MGDIENLIKWIACIRITCFVFVMISIITTCSLIGYVVWRLFATSG